jgi:hypothetical protein
MSDRLAGRLPFADLAAAFAAYDEAVNPFPGISAGAVRLMSPDLLRCWID